MHKMNFEQKPPAERDVGGLPSWVLMWIAGLIVAGMAWMLLPDLGVTMSLTP